MEPYRYSNDETTEIESAASSEGGGIQEQGLKNVLHEKGVTKKFNIFFLIHDVWHYFEVYAEKSTIHGIQYLTEPTARKWHKALWVILLLILYITGATFIAQVFSNYSESRISVNIRAVPGLNEVRFPVVTVCNHNKYSRSYWVRQNLSERSELDDVIRVVSGELHNYGRIYPETQERIGWSKKGKSNYKESFPFAARQPCSDMILKVTQANNSLTHREMARTYFGDRARGPYLASTDKGICCSFHPQLDFFELEGPATRKEQAEKLEKGFRYILDRDLEFIVDIEGFDYGHPVVPTEGIVVALHDIREKPLIQYSGVTLEKNIDAVIRIEFRYITFSESVTKATLPDQRGCITNKEGDLQYLKGNLDYEEGCILNAAYRTLVEKCKCTENLEQEGIYPICAGIELACSKKTLREVLSNERKWTADVRKTNETYVCMEGCEKINLDTKVMLMPLSLANNRIEKQLFDLMADKLLKTTCTNPYKRTTLEERYLHLCDILQRTVMYGINPHYDVEEETSRLILEDDRRENRTQLEKYEYDLVRLLHKYKRENIIKFKIRIGSPEVNIVEHELKMSSLDLIATVGGLIGLMVGFSITSLFELLFHCCALGYGRINPTDLNKDEGTA